MYFIAALTIIGLTLCEILLAVLRGKLSMESSFNTNKEFMGFILKNKGKCFFILAIRPTLCELEDGEHTFAGWGDQDFANGSGGISSSITVSFLNINMTAVYDKLPEEIPAGKGFTIFKHI